VDTLAPNKPWPIIGGLQRSPAVTGPPAGPEPAAALLPPFGVGNFLPSASWSRLRAMLNDGGCYGLAGPRGSGKTWLMRMAVAAADRNKGIGLYFPCPSGYNANSFLSALSNNLAIAVGQRLPGKRKFDRAVTAAWSLAGLITLALIVVALVRVAVHGAGWSAALSASVPGVLRIAAVSAFAIFAASFGCSRRPAQRGRLRLSREASAMRERIRYSASLMLASETGISINRVLAAAISRSHQRTLNERPTTMATLAFDFRSFAELTAKTIGGPLVIGVDELDKIGGADDLRRLLRNIKMIFDVEKVTYLVSISDEAASYLQLGALKSERNEFNSSFSQVIELPPLAPAEAFALVRGRLTEQLSRLLCILAGGNRRELLRMAELCTTYVPESGSEISDEHIAMHLLADESLALLQDISRNPGQTRVRKSAPSRPDEVSQRGAAGETDRLGAEAKYSAKRALPRRDFQSSQDFVKLGHRSLTDEFWNPTWQSPSWERVQDLWRRFLLRLFLTSILLESNQLLREDQVVADLRDVVIMSALDPDVARRMVSERFGSDMPHPYRPAAD
jgi:hypothetical protein